MQNKIFDISKLKRVYAVDFDSCLAKTNYPEIIEPIPHAIETCIALQKQGDIVILFTCRCGIHEDSAVDWLFNQGFVPDYVNQNVPERTIMFGADSRKVSADVYIDDRNHLCDGVVDWLSIKSKYVK